MPPSSPHPDEDRRQFKSELEDERLRDLCALIESGVALEETDSKSPEIPPMPDSMRDQFIELYGDSTPTSAPIPRPEPASESDGFFRTLIDWISGRGLAFGTLAGAAAAVLILVAINKPRDPDSGTDLFRGQLGQAAITERILFYKMASEVSDRLVVDYLEPEVTTRATEADQLQEFLNAHLESVRIVINGANGALERYEPGERQVSRTEPFAGLATISETDVEKMDRLFEFIVSLLEP